MMAELILRNETIIRLGFFAGILVVVGLWEVLAPRRALIHSRWTRWPSNFGIVVLNTLLLRFVFPVTAVALAWLAAERGWGLFNLVDLPYWLAVTLSVVALDFAIYLQHVMVHAIPVFWRLHRMHHTDLDYDVTTGARFHPIEILLSIGIKLIVVTFLGAPPIAVLIFEIMLNATAMFNHGNIHIPSGIDRFLRWIIVTPDMHRVHHSIIPQETNSNFGFSLPWWDRLLGTYRDQPAVGHKRMTIGIEHFREQKYLRIDWLLIQPFLGKFGEYAIKDRKEPAL